MLISRFSWFNEYHRDVPINPSASHRHTSSGVIIGRLNCQPISNSHSLLRPFAFAIYSSSMFNIASWDRQHPMDDVGNNIDALSTGVKLNEIEVYSSYLMSLMSSMWTYDFCCSSLTETPVTSNWENFFWCVSAKKSTNDCNQLNQLIASVNTGSIKCHACWLK